MKYQKEKVKKKKKNHIKKKNSMNKPNQGGEKTYIPRT